MLSSPVSPASSLKLSICITTFNRGDLIAATLESIVEQLSEDCELLILDGASTDNTEQVVSEYARRSKYLRYIKQDTNNGLDRDFDRTIELARGEYCWLMCSDDVLKPGAVAAVLQELRQDYSLVVVGMEIRNADLSGLLVARSPNLDGNRVYAAGDSDRLLLESFPAVAHLSCLVLKRSLWLARERARYYGSQYMHVAVIFQQPLPEATLVLAEPWVCHRFGKQTWRSNAMQMVSRWPTVVGSLCVSESTKKRFIASVYQPNFGSLLLWRAYGMYSLSGYQRWLRPRLHSVQQTVMAIFVGLLPGALVNIILTFYYSLQPKGRHGMVLQMLKDSPFYVRNWRVFTSET